MPNTAQWPKPEELQDRGEEALEELGDEIATLAAHLHAATHRLLTLIAEFDRRNGWEEAGFRTCAHWLAWRTGIALGAAREKVRAARALEELPRIGASMARGELSFAKVRALTRVATPENEGELLELARAGTAAHLERVVRGWRWMEAHDEAEREEARRRSRTFSVVADLDGTYVVRGRLEPEVGALLMRAIEAAADALFRRDQGVEAAQRRADAIGLLAERALAAGFGEGDGAPVSGSRAERYLVVLHAEAERSTEGNGLGGALLEDGTRVSAETSRRLSCDAGVVRLGQTTDGAVLDVGRKTRSIPPALRRALDARDKGCRFPGCGLRFTDAHHVRHWSERGETKLGNLVLLCRFHHRKVHEEGYRVDFPEFGRPNFYDPRGRPLPDAAPPAWTSRRPVHALLRDNRLRGARPEWHTSQAAWARDSDIPRRVIEGAVTALVSTPDG